MLYIWRVVVICKVSDGTASPLGNYLGARFNFHGLKIQFWYLLGFSILKGSTAEGFGVPFRALNRKTITGDAMCCFWIGTSKGWKKFKPRPQNRILESLGDSFQNFQRAIRPPPQTASSFPWSLILPPPGARDPGNEVAQAASYAIAIKQVLFTFPLRNRLDFNIFITKQMT